MKEDFDREGDIPLVSLSPPNLLPQSLEPPPLVRPPSRTLRQSQQPLRLVRPAPLAPLLPSDQTPLSLEPLPLFQSYSFSTPLLTRCQIWFGIKSTAEALLFQHHAKALGKEMLPPASDFMRDINCNVALRNELAEHLLKLTFSSSLDESARKNQAQSLLTALCQLFSGKENAYVSSDLIYFLAAHYQSRYDKNSLEQYLYLLKGFRNWQLLFTDFFEHHPPLMFLPGLPVLRDTRSHLLHCALENPSTRLYKIVRGQRGLHRASPTSGFWRHIIHLKTIQHCTDYPHKLTYQQCLSTYPFGNSSELDEHVRLDIVTSLTLLQRGEAFENYKQLADSFLCQQTAENTVKLYSFMLSQTPKNSRGSYATWATRYIENSQLKEKIFLFQKKRRLFQAMLIAFNIDKKQAFYNIIWENGKNEFKINTLDTQEFLDLALSVDKPPKITDKHRVGKKNNDSESITLFYQCVKKFREFLDAFSNIYDHKKDHVLNQHAEYIQEEHALCHHDLNDALDRELAVKQRQLLFDIFNKEIKKFITLFSGLYKKLTSLDEPSKYETLIFSACAEIQDIPNRYSRLLHNAASALTKTQERPKKITQPDTLIYDTKELKIGAPPFVKSLIFRTRDFFGTAEQKKNRLPVFILEELLSNPNFTNTIFFGTDGRPPNSGRINNLLHLIAEIERRTPTCPHTPFGTTLTTSVNQVLQSKTFSDRIIIRVHTNRAIEKLTCPKAIRAISTSISRPESNESFIRKIISQKDSDSFLRRFPAQKRSKIDSAPPPPLSSSRFILYRQPVNEGKAKTYEERVYQHDGFSKTQ